MDKSHDNFSTLSRASHTLSRHGVRILDFLLLSTSQENKLLSILSEQQKARLASLKLMMDHLRQKQMSLKKKIIKGSRNLINNATRYAIQSIDVSLVTLITLIQITTVIYFIAKILSDIVILGTSRILLVPVVGIDTGESIFRTSGRMFFGSAIQGAFGVFLEKLLILGSKIALRAWARKQISALEQRLNRTIDTMERIGTRKGDSARIQYIEKLAQTEMKHLLATFSNNYAYYAIQLTNTNKNTLGRASRQVGQVRNNVALMALRRHGIPTHLGQYIIQKSRSN